MTATSPGITGQCVHCQVTLMLKPWQLNAMAINEAFTCHHCQKSLQISGPAELKRLKALDSLTLLRASLRVMIASALPFRAPPTFSIALEVVKVNSSRLARVPGPTDFDDRLATISA